MELGTFSITARCPRTGALGVAVTTKRPAVGLLCPYAQAQVGAISSQGRANLGFGPYGLRLLATGYNAEQTLGILLDTDPGRAKRQVAVVDAKGRAAAHTGSETMEWHGHHIGDGFVAAGNILAGPAVVEDMVKAFEASAKEPLPERLAQALEAGQAAGGDKRGKQSAALVVAGFHPLTPLSLRVDDHPDPVAELRRLWDLARAELIPFLDSLPGLHNPEDHWDPKPLIELLERKGERRP
ncbi:MAG: DUF1028 domain-containing protein [Deinococcus sp.]|nr:DUF1028 domain-containing protein [Deinococcus sp.]